MKVDPARGEQHGQDHSQDGPQALPAGGPGKEQLNIRSIC